MISKPTATQPTSRATWRTMLPIPEPRSRKTMPGLRPTSRMISETNRGLSSPYTLLLQVS
ncbi:hypothetical protein PGTUg99_027493 [Puccinia graminis f. sp. tritici]|uniref:Uncharacterized protein n=1 Tax=Puccinia graminis f. sp. tritici TaxID=56615 RepID=A0A5B0MDB7_PUCGR|nr:hypothetical protein PGTUg99_027493 [Puccinia graminis f. sp. tritici]